MGATDEEFRDAVKLYIELHDEIQRQSKELAEVRKRKEALGVQILESMKHRDIDACHLADGGKLVRKEAKRTESLKKEHIIKELLPALGDEGQVERVVNNIFSQRAVNIKESLQRTLK